MADLMAAWPRQDLPRETLEVYYVQLADQPFEAAQAAVRDLIGSSQWLPNVAELKTAIQHKRLELLKARSRVGDGPERWVKCLACGDRGVIMAQQWINGTLYRVTGGCSCEQAPPGIPVLDRSDPAVLTRDGVPFERIAPPAPVSSPAQSYYEPEPPEREPEAPATLFDDPADSGAIAPWEPDDVQVYRA